MRDYEPLHEIISLNFLQSNSNFYLSRDNTVSICTLSSELTQSVSISIFLKEERLICKIYTARKGWMDGDGEG